MSRSICQAAPACRWTGWLAAIVVVLTAALVLIHLPRGSERRGPAQSAIPPLTRSACAGLSDDQLVERVTAECQRRLDSDRRGIDGAAAILPEPALVVWLVATLEGNLARTGFALYATSPAAGTESTPTLARLAAAYRTLGQDALAQVVTDAQTHWAAEGDPLEARTQRERAALDQRFRTAVGPGSATKLAVYARSHLDQLTVAE